MNEKTKSLLKIVGSDALTRSWQLTEDAFEKERIFNLKKDKGEPAQITKYELIDFQLPHLVNFYEALLKINKDTMRSIEKHMKEAQALQDKIKRLESPIANSRGIIESESKRAFKRGYLTRELEDHNTAETHKINQEKRHRALIALGEELLALTKIKDNYTWYVSYPPKSPPKSIKQLKDEGFVRVRLEGGSPAEKPIVKPKKTPDVYPKHAGYPAIRTPSKIQGTFCICPKCGYYTTDTSQVCVKILCPTCKIPLRQTFTRDLDRKRKGVHFGKP